MNLEVLGFVSSFSFLTPFPSTCLPLLLLPPPFPSGWHPEPFYAGERQLNPNTN